MKKSMVDILLQSISLIFLNSCIMCGPDSRDAYVIFGMGDEYAHESNGYKVVEKMSLDNDNKRFVWSYSSEDPEKDKYSDIFSFSFRGNDKSYDTSLFLMTNQKTGEEFRLDVVGDDGSMKHYYKFYGDVIIYISYEQILDDISPSILSGDYEITCDHVIWTGVS